MVRARGHHTQTQTSVNSPVGRHVRDSRSEAQIAFGTKGHPTMSAPRKFLIDCDPGTDDAHAIFMALAYGVDVVAITTVCGNTSVANASVNAVRTLKCCNRLDIPVYRGCEKAMANFRDIPSGFHGEDGFGEAFLDGIDPVDKTLIQKTHAVFYMIEIARSNPGEVTLVSLGPLTNVAIALHLEPELGKLFKDFYVMGGNIEGKGNVPQTAAEFNFLWDPEAVNLVLRNWKQFITIVPMETCYKTNILWDSYDQMCKQNHIKARVMGEIQKKIVSKYRDTLDTFLQVCDPLAMAIAIDPNVATETREVSVTIELHGQHTRGQLVTDWDWLNKGVPMANKNVRIVLDMDKKLFTEMLAKALA